MLVVGTGTIGEPLIALLCRLKDKLQIDEVVFHKRTPLVDEVAKVNSLISMGAKLAVNSDCVSSFQDLGHEVLYTWEEALDRSKAVIDCTPAGNENKEKFYQNNDYGRKLFVAQGSEKGFGIPYALGITDTRVIEEEKGYVQVVSCNTHAIARLISAISENSPSTISSGDFTCIRRANDVSQDGGFSPATSAGKHNDEIFGTHHARDVNDLFNHHLPMPVFSSALKTNTQYMHAVRFSIKIPEMLSRADALQRLRDDEFVCMTKKMSANQIFSFGRDHGFYGRIYSQTVVCEDSVSVFHSEPYVSNVVGVSFTPQDGNSLMSSVAMCLYGLHGNEALYGNNYVPFLKEMMLQNV